MVKGWSCRGFTVKFYKHMSLITSKHAMLLQRFHLQTAFEVIIFEDETHEFWWAIKVKSECSSIFSTKIQEEQINLRVEFQ